MLWAVAVFCILAGLAMSQAIGAIPFLRVMHRALRPRPEASTHPKTAVILCLRGCDPFLPRCLEAVLKQDYPCYDLRIVIDSRQDPAWEVVEQTLAGCGATNVQVRPLTARRDTCSLKCSSLLQAISELDASYEAVALLDADTIPHRTWLAELVAPLADDRVGAATGNRWYMPATDSWGSLVRWLWNAVAVVVMYAFRIPWGGTLALKMSAVRRSNLLERWAGAFCEDTMLYAALRRLRLRIAFVPSLMMVNRETCGFWSFFWWVRRQLLNARLYHPAWVLIVGHAALISTSQLMGFVSLVVALATGHGHAAGWLAAGLGLYWAVMTVLLVAQETSVRRAVAGRGEPMASIRVKAWPRVGAAMLLAQAAYPAAILSALFLRTEHWRGIEYRVGGPEHIRMMDYRPYAEQHRPDQTLQSL